ncbi:hypothetical protein BDN71DRAFT_1394009, partial [Pleurotus eryngii]
MEWMPYQQSFLDKLHRLDGRCGQTSGQCDECNAPNSYYRCQDCLDFTTYCSGCILKGHIALPLHRIECWNPRFCYFERSSLASIGLVIDLGHHGTQCEFTYEIRECVIVDTTGIHNVNVRLCSCGTAVEDPLQFLRVKWF